ncbi:hypothetical protein [Sinomonas sp. P47F7]|uniref:hypothetical protein n=1 Tax=Sinomonas sp. P47F7 TaxID=3410987 RepID=UPI003BF592AA
MRIKNISPYGELDVPLLGGVVEAGEILEVDPEHAEALLAQAENWEPADAAARAVAEELNTDPEPAAAEAVPDPGAPAARDAAPSHTEGSEGL